MVQILALLVAMFIWLMMILWIKASLDFRYSRIEENDDLEIHLSALGGFWKFRLSIPTIKLEWEEGPKIAAEQEAQAPTGETRKAVQQLKMRYFKKSFFYELFPNIPSLLIAFTRLKKKFYRGIHCTEYDWKIEYGHENPAVTALVSGSFWAMLGYSMGRMYNQVTMDVQEPRIMVVPQFKKPGFRCDIQSSFNLRIGHILLVGAELARLIWRRIRK
ncbi:Protein of unknown function (DUF2953) [Desulfitobacterium sp. LBE]|nr:MULTISPECIES: DUF2953 domain-containing protein [Desulfitobacterium]ACL21441.1 hypothetical protein Dhaf_3423 [Desulfitobacterium hafniense DCB-2]TWH60770.1 Protein of unknown function (DUF2953) [Desulfitobacterium sp. LBE]CDX02364.1 Protein of unknown function (DUF2953) [Desulfitobacterium hafniense]